MSNTHDNTSSLTEPAESPEFRMEIVPAADDIDELGHVSNLAYLRWVLEVARAHSAAVGYDHAAYRRLGANFVVHRHEIDYLLPCFEGERIQLITYVAWWRAASSERRTRIVRIADGRELARAVTLWAYTSVASARPRRIPPELREAFRKQPVVPLTTA